MTFNKNISSDNNKDKTSINAIVVSEHWMHGHIAARQAVTPVLNPNQLTSLAAMISYTASKSGQSEYRIERALADNFKVANTKFLPSSNFDAAIRYLADILPL